MSTYSRPWKTFEEQLALLRSRGMEAPDTDDTLHQLSNSGYYRLSAYWYPFRKFELQQADRNGAVNYIRQDQFYPNTHFSDALNLYTFDKRLRTLAFEALECIEVAVRVDIAHQLGKRDAFAHHSISEFHNGVANNINKRSKKTRFDEWQEKYGVLVNRSKEDFVKHYRAKHGQDLPIWVAIEIWDFGAMSQLYAMMKVPDKAKIAEKYGVTWKVFESWLRSLNYLRNLVAHHSRVWNRNVIDQPKLPRRGELDWCDSFKDNTQATSRSFLLLAIAGHLLKKVCVHEEWHLELQVHFESFPEQHSDKKLNISDMGVVSNWKDWWLT